MQTRGIYRVLLISLKYFVKHQKECHRLTLVFGVADDDTIIGLSDAKADAEFVSQKIKERIDPVPQIVMRIEPRSSPTSTLKSPSKLSDWRC